MHTHVDTRTRARTVPHDTIQYGMVQHSTARDGTVQFPPSVRCNATQAPAHLVRGAASQQLRRRARPLAQAHGGQLYHLGRVVGAGKVVKRGAGCGDRQYTA